MKKVKLTIEDIQNSSIEIIKEVAQKEVKGGDIVVEIDIIF